MKIESVTIYFKFIIPQELEGSINQIQINFQFELIFQIQYSVFDCRGTDLRFLIFVLNFRIVGSARN